MIQKRGLHQIVSYVLYSFVMIFCDDSKKRGLQKIVCYVLYCFVMILVMIQERGLQYIVSYVLYCFVVISVMIQKKRSSENRFLCFILFCDDFSED